MSAWMISGSLVKSQQLKIFKNNFYLKV
jgi:hypothetical protein